MLKNIVKFLLVIQIVILIGVAGKVVMNTALGDSLEKVASFPATITATQSVYVMDEEGNVQKNAFLGSPIDIKENNMTITGTAKTDCMVNIAEDVDTVILKDLQQNGHDISINIAEGSGCKVIFENDSEIYDIFSESPVTVESADKTASLQLTNSIYVLGSELRITSGSITAPQLYSEGDIIIEGESCIYLKPMEDQDAEYIYARLEAYDKIVINLTGDGFIDIEGNVDKDLYATYCSAGFETSESTEIVLPENGYAGLWDEEYDDEYCIMTENGDDPDKVLIKAVE